MHHEAFQAEDGYTEEVNMSECNTCRNKNGDAQRRCGH